MYLKFVLFRMVDVGSEWRTFSNDKDSKDMSRVGAAENPLFDGDTLETVMSLGTGAGALDAFGKQKYTNGPRQVSFFFESFFFAKLIKYLDVICR
jgi:transcription initiation factor TFIIIB Brf1 subunit/transcription initiation factor TFIIB